VKLAYMMMSPPGPCLRSATVSAASPLSAVAFHGNGPVNVRDTTSLGILCMASAYGPVLRDHAFSRVSNVDRPIRNVSLARRASVARRPDASSK
jgi:hypothetical protein